MTYYMFLENGKLNGAGECPQISDGLTNIEVNEELYRSYTENPDMYMYSDGEITIDPDYEAKQAQKERQRIDRLTLTPSDVERALYYSPLQMDFDDLKALIAEKAPQLDLKGLAIEFRANNFYRGAVDKNGNRIIDMVGAVLGYTPEDMDYLFEHKQLPVHEEPTVNEEETVEEPVAEPTVEPEAEETAKE